MTGGTAALLERKRDGGALDEREIRGLVRGMADRSLGDAQLGAFAMAVRLRDMDLEETWALTLALRDSGECLDWGRTSLPGPVLDKHSTGGVGDMTSLVLAPLVAACGGFVPMLSGRGLGHTGGTLDKLESLPGYRAEVDPARLQGIVRDCGLAIVGAGAALAPADARLYAIRDVTGTVDSIPLVVASILSKKLAAGAAFLVLDVKRGAGGSFADPALAGLLATRLAEVAARAGLPCIAWITDMSQPLAPSVGNALELRAAIDYLRDDAVPARLHEVVQALGSEMLLAGGLAKDAGDARNRLDAARRSGRGAERLGRMLALLGAPAAVLDAPDAWLAAAPVCCDVPAPRRGVVRAVDARALGRLVVAMGGGRTAPGAAIDHRVGLDRLPSVGDVVQRGQPLARLHASGASQAHWAADAVRMAIVLEDDPVRPPPVLHGRIAGAGA